MGESFGHLRQRGSSVSCIDGGGIRFFATINCIVVLKEIEFVVGESIHKLFNLIVDTGTGGVLTATLGISGCFYT